MTTDEGARLTQMSKIAGCAAKVGPGTLAGISESPPRSQDENLLVGVEISGDGATYKVPSEVALIQTSNFFTLMVDGPYIFGQVVAVDTPSDIYAMDGKLKVALNIVTWPSYVNPKFLGEILRDGANKVVETSTVLAGGHSIQDDESKHGLSIIGFAHPDQVFKNCGTMSGDVSILTKPLGTGIVSTTVKAEMVLPEAQQEAIRVITTLNKKVKQTIGKYEIHSCTDATGFGLAGRSIEMAEGGGMISDIGMGRLPIQQAAVGYAQVGPIPTEAYRNRNFTEEKIEMGNVEKYLPGIFSDPQISGDLLVSAAPEVAEKIIKETEQSDTAIAFGTIGTVTEKQEKYMRSR